MGVSSPSWDSEPTRTARVSRASEPISRDGIIWPADVRDGGEVVRLVPMRVLVVSADRQFRTSTMMLLAHRGCSVTATANVSRAAKLVARDEVEVVVIDAGPAASGEASMAPAFRDDARPVGVVVVSEEESAPDRHPAVLNKWGAFEDLFAAVERAGEARGSREATA